MSKLIIGIIVLASVIAGIAYMVVKEDQVSLASITTFEECAAAGYSIMESYPEQCRTPDGRNFVKNISEPVACTMDAMQCPDGSYVGRSGPNCQFFCPGTVGVSSGIRGKVFIGPTCPVMQNPPAGDCDDKPFQTNLVVTTSDGARVVKSFSSNANGEFSVSVSPGSYLIRSAVPTSLTSCAKGGVVEVRANLYTQFDVNCDSGIR